MKLSKLMHVLSVVAGFAGVITFIAVGLASFGKTEELVFGVTKVHALLCVVVLLLIATWLQIATIHHMMLEKKGELI
jgi:Na+/proline symporter